MFEHKGAVFILTGMWHIIQWFKILSSLILLVKRMDRNMLGGPERCALGSLHPPSPGPHIGRCVLVAELGFLKIVCSQCGNVGKLNFIVC